jgi:hypothetical protein
MTMTDTEILDYLAASERSISRDVQIGRVFFTLYDRNTELDGSLDEPLRVTIIKAIERDRQRAVEDVARALTGKRKIK